MGSLLKNLGQQLSKKLVSRQGTETGSTDSEVTPYTLSDITKPIGNVFKPVTAAVNSRWSALNPSQQEAIQNILWAGGGAAAVGGTLGLLSTVYRKHRNKLLNESVPRAALEYPVIDDPSKSAGFADRFSSSMSGGLRGSMDIGSGLGSIALDAMGSGGQAIRDEQARVLDPIGTIVGNHAKNWWNVPWAIPATVGALGLGSIGAYKGVRSLVRSHDKASLDRRKRKAKQKFMDALVEEQQSKLGSVLDDYIDAVVEAAPSIKEASALELYLAGLGLAGLGGGIYGFSRSYGPSKKKSDREALEQVRALQEAKYRFETPEIIPDYRLLEDKKKAPVISDKAASFFPTLGNTPMKKEALIPLVLGGLAAAEGIGAAIQNLAPGGTDPSKYMNDAGWWASYLRPTQIASRIMGMKANPITDSKGRNYYGTWARNSTDPNRTSNLTWKGPISGITWDKDRWTPDFSKMETHFRDGGWDFWEKPKGQDVSHLSQNTVIPKTQMAGTQQSYTPSLRNNMRFG
jgi:hypothetical protein